MSDHAPPTLKGLANRLKMPKPMVRKIAIMDLIHRDQQQPDDQAAAVLRDHLGRETDPDLRARIEQYLAQRGR